MCVCVTYSKKIRTIVQFKKITLKYINLQVKICIYNTCRNEHITETKSRRFCIKMYFSPAAAKEFSKVVTFDNEEDKFSSVLDKDATVRP